MPKAEQGPSLAVLVAHAHTRADCVQRELHDPDRTPVCLCAAHTLPTQPCPMRAIPVLVSYPRSPGPISTMAALFVFLSVHVLVCVCVCICFFALFPLASKRPRSRHRPRPHFLFGATLRYTCVRNGTGRAHSLARSSNHRNNHHPYAVAVPVPVPGTCQPVCRWRRIVRKFTS